jgi:chloramphenicol 3-O phosphotransferase
LATFAIRPTGSNHSWDVHLEDGLEYFRITPGPILDCVMRGRTIAIEWLLDVLRIFAPYRVYVVGVFVSDEEGARREQQRGDRHAGWDRGPARFAHHDALCDLRIDTTHETPWGCADGIERAVRGGLASPAFAEMRRRYLAP